MPWFGAHLGIRIIDERLTDGRNNVSLTGLMETRHVCLWISLAGKPNVALRKWPA